MQTRCFFFSLPSASSGHCLFKVNFAEDSECFFVSFFFFLRFIYFNFLTMVGFVAMSRFSVVVVSGDFFRCGAQASRCRGFSCCGPRAPGNRSSVVVAHRLAGSSWTRG